MSEWIWNIISFLILLWAIHILIVMRRLYKRSKVAMDNLKKALDNLQKAEQEIDLRTWEDMRRERMKC